MRKLGLRPGERVSLYDCGHYVEVGKATPDDEGAEVSVLEPRGRDLVLDLPPRAAHAVAAEQGCKLLVLLGCGSFLVFHEETAIRRLLERVPTPTRDAAVLVEAAD